MLGEKKIRKRLNISLPQALSDKKRGRSSLCWRDTVDEDARMLRIRNE